MMMNKMVKMQIITVNEKRFVIDNNLAYYSFDYASDNNKIYLVIALEC